MSVADPASRWCPSCGDEYRPDIEQCAECQIPLVDEEPTELHPVPTGGTAVEPLDEPFVIDLVSLTEEQRSVLAEHVESVPVPVRIVGEGLIQAEDGYDRELELALSRVLIGEAPGRLAPTVELTDEPLTLGRRAFAVLVDAVATGLLTWLAYTVSSDASMAALVLISTLAIGHVVGLGERGRSLGKAVVGAGIRTVGGQRISGTEAGVRWFVRDAPWLVALGISSAIDDPGGILLIVQLAGIGCLCGLIGSVVVDQQRRGLHDLLVETAVGVRPS